MQKAALDSLYKLPKTHRLVNQADFQSVFSDAQKITNKSLLALYKPNLAGYARLGIIIAKHHVKLAVGRNQIRRVLRESFRSYQTALKGLDIIILLRSEWSPSGCKKVLREDIDKLWRQLAESAKSA